MLNLNNGECIPNEKNYLEEKNGTQLNGYKTSYTIMQKEKSWNIYCSVIYNLSLQV